MTNLQFNQGGLIAGLEFVSLVVVGREEYGVCRKGRRRSSDLGQTQKLVKLFLKLKGVSREEENKCSEVSWTNRSVLAYTMYL